MTYSVEKIQDLGSKYGNVASWAVWAGQKDPSRAKSGVDDLSIFDLNEANPILKLLHCKYVLVGLNVSRDVVRPTFSNFHSGYRYAQDYKLRLALNDTPMSGAWMTDIIKGAEADNIKGYAELKASKLMRYLKENPKYEREQANLFRQELKDIGAEQPVLVAFGSDTEKVLRRNFENDGYRIAKLTHYSHAVRDDDLQDQVRKLSVCSATNKMRMQRQSG